MSLQLFFKTFFSALTSATPPCYSLKAAAK